jgi:hypothetical protein
VNEERRGDDARDDDDDDDDDDAGDDGCARIDVDEERKKRGRAPPRQPAGVGNRERECETGRDDDAIETCGAGERKGGWIFGECIGKGGDG